ncbi:hypothetical protein ACU4GD_36795 [Cupriavidus basilensis]
MEYSFELQPDVVVVPRNHEYVGTGPGDKPGIRWKSRYAVAGRHVGRTAGACRRDEREGPRGVATSTSRFRRLCVLDPAKADPAKSIASWQLRPGC